MRRRTALQQLIGRDSSGRSCPRARPPTRRGADRACAAPDVPGSRGSARRRSGRSCARPGRETSSRKPTCGASSSSAVGVQRVLELGQQLLAIDDRDHAVVAGAVGDVDAILLGPRRDRRRECLRLPPRRSRPAACRPSRSRGCRPAWPDRSGRRSSGGCRRVHPSSRLFATRYAMPVSHSHQLLCVPLRLVDDRGQLASASRDRSRRRVSCAELP